ncbi:MAG: TonB-dependent receptor plug domain-containing protein, partial [Gammaproteobacteria bacterium]
MSTCLCAEQLAAGALVALLTMSAHVAGAEEAPAVETLVVTAHRVPLSEAEVGSSVTSVGRDLMDQRQIVLVSDLLQDVTGLAVSRLGGPGGQTQVRVRGAEANHVLVLIDGVKANDPAGGDEFDFSSLTAWDVGTIEVVRGPQSALWGSEATAGVINIITRGPGDGLSAAGFVEGGSRDTLYTGARVGAGGERGGLVLNGSWFETRGESAALAGVEDDGLENLTLGLSAGRQPDERVETVELHVRIGVADA